MKQAVMDGVHALLVALAAGDCLGVTSEFAGRDQVARCYEKHRDAGWPWRPVGGGPFGFGVGVGSDDTDMAVAIVRSFAACDEFDPADVAQRFVAWMQTHPPDTGGTVRSVLRRISQGTPWYDAGYQAWQANPNNAANGSLMRNGVMAGMAGDLDEALRITLLQSIITHYGPLAVLCCAAQTWLIWRLREGVNPLAGVDWVQAFRDDWQQWLEQSEDEHVQQWRSRVGEVAIAEAWQTMTQAEWDHRQFDPFQMQIGGIAGYCLLTLQVATWALGWSLSDEPFPCPSHLPAQLFEERGPMTLGWIALIGADSDTYGATAGPLLHAAHGTLPEQMTEPLTVLDKLG